jgi:chromosome segregation ATPase
MKINVIGDAEVDEPGNKVEAGETFNPATFPDGKMPEPKTIEPETKEDKEPELPTSPVDEEEKSKLESKEEVEAEGSTEMDSTDKRLMAAIEEWNKAKERTYDKLKKLKEDVEADINRTRADIADLEKHVEIKEKEREEIQNQLDELGDVKSAA